MKMSGESNNASGMTKNPAATARRILVVDDDSSVREMVTRVLAGEGYAAWAAADGKAATEIASTMPFDLVLLDMNVRGRNEIIEAFKQHASPPAIIIMTARSNRNFKAAGAEAFLEKPLDFTKLLQTVSQLLTK